MSAVWATFFYGVLALVGGILGYIKAKSKPSLIFGGISGIILILSGILQFLGQSWALWVAIAKWQASPDRGDGRFGRYFCYPSD